MTAAVTNVVQMAAALAVALIVGWCLGVRGTLRFRTIENEIAEVERDQLIDGEAELALDEDPAPAELTR
ncbi:hypothetical protein [Mycolicibacterium komossense]|uniref:Secreted protein n=1 Tax=Mycolicibacterium komossense TaxID=1779 RepID=A0ABT3CMR8_9MYCO|nr:hypothetical protein [Mycolicibacterium komossense]MCV7230719.1 hypothetical protein [Mycolicibacterium komossense]